MRKLILFLLICFYPVISNAQEGSFKYTVDLTKVENDHVGVELLTPSLSASDEYFRFPKVVPGTYAVYNFGRFISEFKAYDKNGAEINAERYDINSWKLADPVNTYKITYKVGDSYDTRDTGKVVFEPVGSFISDNKFYEINGNTYFGYFDNLRTLPYEVTIMKPAGFYGSTALVADETTETSDKYLIPSYFRVVDSPMLYSMPDTTVVNVGNTKVLVSVYSPNKMINSKELAEDINDVLISTQDYLGGLPVENYAFLFMFHEGVSPSKLDGALEHSYSSLYSLPEVNFNFLKQQVKNFTSHEFLHIITPLSIHSEEIGSFNYNAPEMSRHLWMYEGVTEYTSRIVQVKAGLMDVNKFLDDTRSKIFESERYVNGLPFTEFSRQILDEKYNKDFINVYNKGALIGMLLDIKLRSLSGGGYGVREMMKDLATKYGKDVSFKDEELFDVITSFTYPEIRDFFRKFVEGTDPLPYKEYFNLAGINFYETKSVKKYTLGNVQIGYNPLTKRLVIEDVSDNGEGNIFKFKKGDEFTKFNKKTINLATLQDEIDEVFNNAKEGDELEIEVMRNDKPVKLTAELEKESVEERNVIELNSKPTPEQLKTRSAWLEKN